MEFQEADHPGAILHRGRIYCYVQGRMRGMLAPESSYRTKVTQRGDPNSDLWG